MHDASGPARWTLGIGNGSGFTYACFVRDRFAIPAAPDLPALEPAVGSAPGRADGALEQAWEAWWERLRSAEPGAVVPPDHDPRLLALWTEVEHEARQWEDDHVPLDPPYRPAWTSAWMDEHLPAGASLEHSTDVLGVGGRWHRTTAPSRLLVSVATYRDHAEMDRVLRAALTAAVGG